MKWMVRSQKLDLAKEIERKISKTGLQSKYCFLLDCSGSMSDEMTSRGGKTKLAILKKALTDLVLKNQEFRGSRFFSFGFTVEKIKFEDLEELSPGGDTPMLEALEKALSWARSAPEDGKVLLFTDGEPTDAAKEVILEFVTRFPLPIDTVGIGEPGLGYDPEFLKRIAEITGGTFLECATEELLLQAPQRLLLEGGGAIEL